MKKTWSAMADQGASHRGMALLVIAAAFVVILWGINQAQSVIVLFLVSGFLAVVARVPVVWLERKRIPPVIAVSVVVLAMVIVILSTGFVIGTSLNEFSNSVPVYQARIHDMLLSLKGPLARKGIIVSDKVLLGYINPGAVMELVPAIVTAMSSVLSNVVLILFTVLFILLEALSFPAKLRSVLDNPHAAFPRFARYVDDIKRYMVIKTVLNLVSGVLTAVWLTILGVDFPVLWGFLAFLLHFVPNVGFLLAAVPAVLLALVQLGGGAAALTGAGYLVLSIVLGNIVEPRVMGSRLGMSTLVVFLSVIIWGSLLGIVGALLCVPLTMTVKLACDSNKDTRWIAVLLGHEVFPERIPPEPKDGSGRPTRRVNAHSRIRGSS
jgi:predicted PurR-regulated permease PerM